MKKILLLLCTVAAAGHFSAQTATNWTVNDCTGNPHTLFSELDAGKVVVITWVMPCGACIAPSLTAANTVNGMGNPNVVFYLVDDYGNTNCASLNSWASTNGINATAKFTSTAIDMTDYGTAGMPKTVVLGGGTCHTVFFNVNGSITQNALQTAINNALTPCTGVPETNAIVTGAGIFPNPATAAVAALSYTLTRQSEVSFELINILGEKVSHTIIGEQAPGKYEHTLDLSSLSPGVYFIKLRAGEAVETVKLTVSR
ncbi:MAG: T9SS type A sorting domain-containing protein [Bacteroidota bacterium]